MVFVINLKIVLMRILTLALYVKHAGLNSASNRSRFSEIETINLAYIICRPFALVYNEFNCKQYDVYGYDQTI
jgi:hypothetical protein